MARLGCLARLFCATDGKNLAHRWLYGCTVAAGMAGAQAPDGITVTFMPASSSVAGVRAELAAKGIVVADCDGTRVMRFEKRPTPEPNAATGSLVLVHGHPAAGVDGFYRVLRWYQNRERDGGEVYTWATATCVIAATAGNGGPR